MDFGAGAFGFEAGVTPLFLSPAGVNSSVEVRDPHLATLISWPWRRLETLLAELGDGRPADLAPLAATGFRSPLIMSALELLRELGTEAHPPSALLEDSVATVLAAELRRLAIQNSNAARPIVGGLSPGRLRKAQSLLVERLANPVGLKEVAEHVGMSQFHFWRCFHLSVGCSPHRWLLRVRLERACDLLKTSRLTITDIALEVGYQTSQAFSRAFRQEMGCTPAQYRARFAA
jgi:AraC family transcriptional regulator